jgi:DNA-binding transcriptional ArsR family regulator
MSSRRLERRGEDAVFHAMADETRRRLLDELRVAPRSTGELCRLVPGMSRFGVMDHLAVLVEAGLVIRTRRGRERINHLNPVPIQAIYERWMRPFAAPAARELLALEAALTREQRGAGDVR